MAKSAEKDLSTNQGETLSAMSRDGDESKTLIEDSKETEEESGECGFCTFIKGGECKEAWIALEKCVEEEEEEAEEESGASKCREVRIKFRTCLFENPDYYEPLISGEAKIIANMLTELQVEKEALLAGDAEAISKALNKLRTEEQPVSAAEAAAIAKAYRDLEEEKEEEKAEGSKGN